MSDTLQILEAPAPAARLGRLARLARFLGSALVLAWLIMGVMGAMLLAVDLLGVDVSRPDDEEIGRLMASWGPGMILFVGVSAGIVEELLFRILPLGAALWLGRRLAWQSATRRLVLALLVLATSVGFAYAHGGHRTLLFQGPIGLVLALAFLREEGRAGWKRAALLVMTGHALYDIGLLGGAQALEAVSGSLGRG